MPTSNLLIATALILLLSVIWIVRRSQGTPLLLFPLLAAGLSVALSTLTAVYPGRSIFGLLVTMVVIVVYVLLVELDSEILGSGLAGLLFAFALLGVFNAGRKAINHLFIAERFNFYDITGSLPGLNPNIYAVALLAGSALAVKHLRSATRREWKVRTALWLATTYVALVLTMSRGGWIGWVAGAVTLVALDPDLRAALAKPRRAAAAAITLGLLNPVVLRALHRIAQPTFAGGVASAVTSTGRRQIWQGAVEQFLERPIVGVGLWNFGPLFDARYQPSAYKPHAHNLLLQTAAETGIIGLLTLAAVLITAGVLILRAYRDPERRDAAVLAATFAAALMAEGVFDYPYAGPLVDIIVLGVWNRILPANVPTKRWHIIAFVVGLGLMFAAQIATLLLIGPS